MREWLKSVSRGKEEEQGMVEMSFSFDKAMTHSICCFCQHMILFSNFGKENYSSFSCLKSVGAVMFFSSWFWTVCCRSLLFCFPTWIWSFGIFGMLALKNSLDVLSELIHCKVSFIVWHPLLLAGGCADAISLVFSSPISLLRLSNKPDDHNVKSTWTPAWLAKDLREYHIWSATEFANT